MPKSKFMHKYGTEIQALARKISDNMTIKCSSEKEAKDLRFELYGFRKAVELERMEMNFFHFMRAKILVNKTPDGEWELQIIQPDGRFSHLIDPVLQSIPEPPAPETHQLPDETTLIPDDIYTQMLRK